MLLKYMPSVIIKLNCHVLFSSSTSLVPVFSFGENEVFRQINNPRGSWLRSFQGLFKKYIGLSPPLFYARGFFNYNFGILPFRKPIETVGKYPDNQMRLC